MKFISSLNWEINVPDSLLIKTSWHLINRYHLWRAVDSSDRVFLRRQYLTWSEIRFMPQWHAIHITELLASKLFASRRIIVLLLWCIIVLLMWCIIVLLLRHIIGFLLSVLSPLHTRPLTLLDFCDLFSVYALDNTSGVYFTSITPLPGLQ